eukprot:TRINITY_DN3100_c0_g1_i5.p1 TRINITY_DN3100_c0_g1~~TRINITY_DN3100_c0_g1_i5.p1  ORF type:complete len:222 (-),score=45.16 TRINITY_DN3100_c0_g1_i5:50-715(-)
MSRNETYRGADKLTPIKQSIQNEIGDAVSILPVVMDSTNEDSVKQAFNVVRTELGEVDVLVYNAGARDLQNESVLDVPTEKFIKYWEANCLGGFYTAREVLPSMKYRGEGCILFTGATGSLRASSGLSSFSVGKFGLRALAQSLAREFSPQGIHVAHIIIDGAVDIPIIRKYATAMGTPENRLMNPDEIAKQYWNIYQQHPTVWTHELDLRPHTEPIFSKL